MGESTPRERRTAWLRAGGTIRRVPGPNPDYVRRLLGFLEEAPFDGAPRFLGIDHDGLDVFTFVEGSTPDGLNWGRWSDEQLVAAFHLLRRFHDATAGSPVADGQEVACHNDFSPPNLVFRDGLPVVIIDWEWAAPGTRRHDLAHATWQWLNLGEDGPPAAEQARRMRLVVATYGLPTLEGIIDNILFRQDEWLRIATRAVTDNREFAGRSPAHWSEVKGWVERERGWLLAHRRAIEAALTP
jgi:hypothetical protein